MKTPCRHYNRFGSSFCKTEHAYPDHTHTPSSATRVALCGSHTPKCAEQRRKMAHKRDQYHTARQSSRSPIPLPPAIGHAETLRGGHFFTFHPVQHLLWGPFANGFHDQRHGWCALISRLNCVWNARTIRTHRNRTEPPLDHRGTCDSVALTEPRCWIHPRGGLRR